MTLSNDIRRWIARATLSLVLLCSFTHASAQYDKEYFYYMGRHFMMNDDYYQAIRTLNVLLRFDEDAHEGYFLRGIAKYNLEDLLGADADFSTAIEKNPVFTKAYTYRAITRSRLGNYDDALQDFHQAIELRPDLPGPYYSRGVTRLLNKQYDKAIEDFDMFLRKEKKVADAYVNRGVCYLQLRDTVRAYEDFSTAIRTNREDPNPYNRRGALLMEQRRYAEAEEDLNTAIRHDSTYLLSFFNRALVYNYTNRPLQALSDFDHVIALDSTSSLTYFNRAILRQQIGDYNRALEDYNRVAHYSPDNVLVYYNRAGLHLQLGDLTQSTEDYTRAIELYPDFANAYLGRSHVRLLMGDRKGASADHREAQRKIAEYKERLTDTTYSIYADTTQRFDKLLSFEARTTRNFESRAEQSGATIESDLHLLPLYKFTLIEADSALTATRKAYHAQRLIDFEQRLDDRRMILSRHKSNLSPDTLVAMDRAIAQRQREESSSWLLYFQRAITQSLIKQYTNAVATLSLAIQENPANPFLYINRSTTRAEMIDFISSIDNSFQRISIDSDPANRLRQSSSRTYNYDDAIEDITKAIKLYPDFAYAYYNRAGLYAISGRLPEAYDDYTRAIELNPAFGDAYYNRGLVQIFMKDTRKGCLDLSKAGELGVENAYEALRYYSE
ncbi:MAG: tetratricopeptide repeat protein [Rikenellaceae bacterium]|nr:tetratricopeptide repeat protein [Rikenellaceae bacterium]